MYIRSHPSSHWIPAFAGMTEKYPSPLVTPVPIFIGMNSSRSPVKGVSEKRPCLFNYGLNKFRTCYGMTITDDGPVFLYFNFARVFFASSAPENFGSNSRALLSSFLAGSLSPFL
jgi:hypothetical protein